MDQKKYLAHLSALALTIAPFAPPVLAPAAAHHAQVSPEKSDLLGELLRSTGGAQASLVGVWCQANWAERCDSTGDPGDRSDSVILA